MLICSDLRTCVQSDRVLKVDYGSQLFNDPKLVELTAGFPEERYRPDTGISIDISLIAGNESEKKRVLEDDGKEDSVFVDDKSSKAVKAVNDSVPFKPVKKLEAVSDDDWNDTPSIPPKPVKKLEAMSDDDWNDTPSIPPKPVKKLEAVSDDDWNDTPSQPVKRVDSSPANENQSSASQHKTSRRTIFERIEKKAVKKPAKKETPPPVPARSLSRVSTASKPKRDNDDSIPHDSDDSFDWEQFWGESDTKSDKKKPVPPPLPTASKPKLSRELKWSDDELSDDWNDLPKSKSKKEMEEDDWNDLPKSKSKKEVKEDDWNDLPKSKSKKEMEEDDRSKPTRRQSVASVVHPRKSSKPVIPDTNSDWSVDDDLPVETEKKTTKNSPGDFSKPTTKPVSTPKEKSNVAVTS